MLQVTFYYCHEETGAGDGKSSYFSRISSPPYER